MSLEHRPGESGSLYIAGSARPPEPPPVVEPEPAKQWQGEFQPYEVGDPGKAAATVRPKPDWSSLGVPDTVIDGVCIGDGPDVELRAASMRGLSHRFYGTVRQDAYAFCRAAKGRYLVAVVSDGVSKSPKSHRAAEVVTFRGARTIAEYLEFRRPEDLDWAEVVEAIADRLVEECHDLGVLRDIDRPTRAEVAAQMAATGVFAILELRPPGEAIQVDLFAIGDSAAWILRDGRHWENQFELGKTAGAVATSKTEAFPLIPRRLAAPVPTVLRPTDMLMLVSDGIGDPLGDGTGAVGRFLAEAWARPPALLEFAAQAGFARRSHDDDRTALAIWPVRTS